VLDSTLDARAGDSETAVRPASGSLLVSLDPNRRSDPDTQFNSRFPLGARAIELAESVGLLSVSAGSAIPDALNGFARLSARSITAGGFESVTAIANTLEGVQNGQQLLVPGEIRFRGDVNLSVGQRLILDAAALSGDGGHVRLVAPYVALGHADRARQTVPLLTDGRGSLKVEAQLVDLVGASVINGFGRTELASSGDIRRGVQPINGRSIVGSLTTSGDLSLTADQIYPTTLSQFEIAVRGSDERRLEIFGTGDARGDVLSAGGALTLRGPTVLQAGVLRAPIGSISLIAEGSSADAGNLVLAPGSLASTSAEGLTIPFGSTQGGFDWVYELEEGQTLAFEPGGATLPSQQVTLDAARVDFQSGATVDISGGGDLLAYEFLPGPGGSRDILSGTVRPNQFAVVPGLKGSFAPYDPREYRGYDLRAGDSVYLAGADGLPAGEYVLLPARYALLPGAYLVTAVSGYQDIGNSERYAQADGSTVVAGHRTFTGSGTGSARASGFAVRTAAVARSEALYTTSTANQFFASQAAADGGTAPITPRDAGAVAIAAAQQLILDGTLRATTQAGARGSRVDFASSRVRIGDSATVAENGEVVIDAAALNGLGAQSVLIGGRRQATADGMQVQVTASSVTVDEGAQLSGPELLLAARERVIVESDSSISASGAASTAAPDTLLLQGDGALLRVAQGDAVDVARTASTGATGVLDLREGASIVAPGGAVFLDASGDMSNRARLDVRGGSLGFGAQRVSLARHLPARRGLLSAGELGALGLDELRLASRSTIDLYGPVELSTNSLSLLAPEIRPLGDDNATARLRAAETLSWSSPDDDRHGAHGRDRSRQLELAARNIELDGGALAVTGAAGVALSASDEIRFRRSGSLDLAGDAVLKASGHFRRCRRRCESCGCPAFHDVAADTGPANHVASAGLGARLSVLAAPSTIAATSRCPVACCHCTPPARTQPTP
jgi:hypothetical protein